MGGGSRRRLGENERRTCRRTVVTRSPKEDIESPAVTPKGEKLLQTKMLVVLVAWTRSMSSYVVV